MSRKYVINGAEWTPECVPTSDLTAAMEMEENVPGGQDVKHVQEERNGPAGFDNVAFQHTEDGSKDEPKRGRGDAKDCTGDDPATTSTFKTSCFVFAGLRFLKATVKQYSDVIWRVVKVVLFLLYLAYSVYSLYRTWGTESATRLLLLLAIVLYVGVGSRLLKLLVRAVSRLHVRQDAFSWARKVGRWSLYVIAAVGAVVYVVLEVALQNPYNLVSLAGLVFLVLVALLMSSDPERVNWHTVFWGIALQFYLAIFMLRTSVGYSIFVWMGDRIEEFIQYTDSGSIFLFGESYTDHPFVFRLMPILIFLNSVIAICITSELSRPSSRSFGRLLSLCLGTTPIESVNAAANVFLSLISATHLLAASVMSAPAALAIAKLIHPSTTPSSATTRNAYKVDLGQRILSYVFYPLMYICGVDSQDLLVMSRLVGLKFLSNIQIAYREAGVIIANSKELEEYISLTNGTWYYSGDDVILEAWNQTLTGGVMSARTQVMSTYVMCGFCNLPALAICAGTLSALAPKRATFIVNNVVVALIAGNIACFMTGCVA
ncbi:hypothetical protein BaRGS_00030789, partial [Batillaria attramentaria]